MKRAPRITRRSGRNIKSRYQDNRKDEIKYGDHNAHVLAYYEFQRLNRSHDSSSMAAVIAMVGIGMSI